MKKDYVCRDNRLHNYENVLRDDDDAIVEQCILCGWKIHFKKINGRIETKRYGETHKLWYLQPGDEEFEKYYGKYVPPKPDKWKTMSFEERKAAMAEELNQGLKEDHNNRKHILKGR